MAGNNDEARRKLWDLIAEIHIGMLTTRDGAVLRSRPMAAFLDREQDALWFFTSAQQHTAEEVAAQPDVNVSFVDAQLGTYVSLSGHAELVDDREKAAALWTPEVAAWAPENIDAPDLRLLRVSVTQAEYWDRHSNAMHVVWRIAQAALGQQAEPREDNRKLRLAQ